MGFTNPYPASRLTLDATASINSGLQGYWPLTDGGSTAKDITSNANDGTLQGNAAFVSSGIGAALSCSGVSSSGVSVPTNPSASVPITVSAWFKTSNTSSDMYIIDGDDSSDRIAIYRNVGGTLIAYANGSAFFGTSNSVIADGNWHHVAAVYTSSGITVYFDGEPDGTGTAATTSLSGLRIGGRYSNTSNWDGELQNVRVYNRALSATEVATLYNRPWEGTNYGDLWPYSPPAPADATLSTDTAATSLMSGCVGWWPLTDGSGSTATDITTGGNHFTQSGSPAWESTELGVAVDFNGTTDNYKAQSNSILSFGNGTTDSPFSIAAWIKIDGGDTTANPIFSKTDGNGSGSTASEVEYTFTAGWNGSNHEITFIIYDDNGNQQEKVIGGSSISTGDWHFCCCTYDGSGDRFGMEVYLDGVIESPTRSNQGSYVAMHSLSFPAMIGSSLPNEPLYDQWMNGNIQNVRIWDRVLSADEISLLYERPWEGIEYGDAFHYDPPTPANLTPLTSDSINNSQIGWWPLTETDDYASGAADISGNSNNGTQSGGVLSEVSSLGGVASLDGTNDRFDLTTLGGHDAYTTATTVSMWCYLRDDSFQQYWFNKHDNANSSFVFFAWTPANGDLELKLKDGSDNSVVRKTFNGLATQILDRWAHLVFVSAGSDFTLASNLDVYVDGVLQTATSSGNGDGFGNGEESGGILSLGGRYYDNNRNIDADFQNVRVWSRALTADEVWSIYENPWLGSAYTATAAEVLYNYIFRSQRFRRLA